VREARVGPEVVVKPEVRCRSFVARFAVDVVFEVAIRFEFKMDSDCVDVRWLGVVVREWSWVVDVGSEIECV